MNRKQMVEAAINDPDTRAEIAADPLVADRTRLYATAASPLLTELAAAGFPGLTEVGQLRGHGDYRSAVPVLVRWLPRVRYLLLAEDIVRTLSVPFARKAAYPTLLAMFRDPPELTDPMRPETSEPPQDHLRTVIGDALATFAGPATADDLLGLVETEAYGDTRAFVVLALPKTKDSRVPGVLMGLLGQPSVAAFAVQALGRLRCTQARDDIAGLLDNPDENVREQARKALKRIDQADRAR
ncbi:HEAT repeat domain-containing protein [Mangrovihabitans endophyticus]|uniref:HEAT repeat-containing protein n=1 Tax=Mangrovihabitans endophyticus TaxID=1751298 RepID=A0A8J3FLB4_9ACTN|nr:HEAT repeat domain-containing protein [Mangrovihabitans endophyticus]GGK75602.1 hypothetical protein GCM10012284_06990 [Mangrovihabitans endophyticus]